MMDKPPNVAYYPDYYWQGNSAVPSQVNVENFSYSPPPAYLTAAALNQGNVNQGGGNGGRGTVFSKPPSSFYIKKWILLATISFNLLTMIFGLASVELIVAQMTSKHQKVIDSMICLYRSCEGATSEEMMVRKKAKKLHVNIFHLFPPKPLSLSLSRAPSSRWSTPSCCSASPSRASSSTAWRSSTWACPPAAPSSPFWPPARCSSAAPSAPPS